MTEHEENGVFYLNRPENALSTSSTRTEGSNKKRDREREELQAMFASDVAWRGPSHHNTEREVYLGLRDKIIIPVSGPYNAN